MKTRTPAISVEEWIRTKVLTGALSPEAARKSIGASAWSEVDKAKARTAVADYLGGDKDAVVKTKKPKASKKAAKAPEEKATKVPEEKPALKPDLSPAISVGVDRRQTADVRTYLDIVAVCSPFVHSPDPFVGPVYTKVLVSAGERLLEALKR